MIFYTFVSKVYLIIVISPFEKIALLPEMLLKRFDDFSKAYKQTTTAAFGKLNNFIIQLGTVISTSDYTLWTSYRSYFKG
jgi:hypothetical protein